MWNIGRGCAVSRTQLPWIENPFRLISWWDMNKFSAEAFVKISALLGANIIYKKDGVAFKGTLTQMGDWLDVLGKECKAVGLRESARQAFDIVFDFDPIIGPAPGQHSYLPAKLEACLGVLLDTIQSEMKGEIFFWVPSHRSEWYSKKSEQIVSDLFAERFPIAATEIEEAAKCFSFGRYTACVFHLSRATEAGIKAVGIALNQKKDHELIERTLKFIEEQTKLNAPNQIVAWRSHGAFFATIAGDVRAVAKAWRNKVCHLVADYKEEQAKELLELSTILFRHIAEKIDDKGNLY